MEKKLILEINRINKLMGTDSNIISEGNVIGKILKTGLDYIKSNIKKIPNTTDEFMVGSIKIRKLMFDRLKDFLEGTINDISLLSAKESYTLGRILSQDTKLASDIYDDVIKDFLKNNPDATEKELLDMIDYQLRISGDPRKTLKDIFKNPSSPNESELRAGLLEDIIQKKINLVPEVEMSATRQFIQGMKMSTLEYLKKIPYLKKKLEKVYFQQLQPLDNLQKQFLQVSDKIKSKVSGGGDYEITEELKEMNSILSQFAIQTNKQQGLVWEEWKKLVGPEFVDKMPKFEDPKFQEFYKYFENSVNTKNPPSLVFTKMDAAKRMFTWGKNGFLGNLNVFRKRLGNSLVALDPRTVSEFRQNLEKFGTARGLGKEFGDKTLAALVFWPSIFAVIQTTLDYVEYAVQKKFDIDIPAGDAEFVKNNEPIVNSIIVDNIFNAAGNVFGHWLENMGIGAKDLTSLFGWSPTLWLIGQKFLGGKKGTNDVKKTKDELQKADEEVKAFTDTAKGVLSTDPQIVDSLKKLNPEIEEIINSTIDEEDKIKDSFVEFIKKDERLAPFVNKKFVKKEGDYWVFEYWLSADGSQKEKAKSKYDPKNKTFSKLEYETF